MKPIFKIDDREFTRTLNTYKSLSKRTPAYIVNKKAFYILRRAVLETPAASKEAIVTSLGTVRRGKKKITTKLAAAKGMRNQELDGAPLAALIVNARRARAGLPGLYGQSMAAAVAAMIGARNRSRAFIKSGWLTGVKAFAALVGNSGPAMGPAPKQIGRTKGRAVPARESVWSVKAIFENLATTKRDVKQALIMYGQPALQRAFDFERESMKQWIEDELKKQARAAGIKVT